MNSINYAASLEGVDAGMLSGFFEGWAKKPSAPEHLRILQGSAHVVLAVDADKHKVVGFITAVSDGVHSAFIPLLEVLPEYRGRGIGTELVKRMLHILRHYPCIDLCCDLELQPFYARLGMSPSVGMLIRDSLAPGSSRRGP